MFRPIQISEDSETQISIEWSDGRKDVLQAAVLRRRCPCASCIDEWTGQKRLVDSSVPDDLRITDLSLVGRYALNVTFSDGHNTGLYTFETLRDIGGGAG
jgi:DUF971 family protein